ncbi:acyl-CoA dehydrogenase [Sphaerisporangium siamense]|uniref:Alkylation response protein AidB-like acyl-CoA dehydrogenase n=1 Tax=Sphaerisporangium siamense TaxID=795645 RepID=A0A7W7D2K2_9ACTN|nr:acyl-CoA dehydrogenase [Sphaerisporangium siamense]MBB4699107.1 alkylation response protein AidB-like acyl-CoA dehydrogenase [Sphaerisporangium siamense]GII86766.1 acyl-CoA dehydrogenase [Sphaerisporangium siamense]
MTELTLDALPAPPGVPEADPPTPQGPAGPPSPQPLTGSPTSPGLPGPVARFAGAAGLDRSLGDPASVANPFGFAAAAARDEAAAFPAALSAAAGPALRLSYVPRADGGTLDAADETLMTVRAAARRDLTVMPATMFGITAATCVLLAGDAAQRARVTGLLSRGGAVGFALTEDVHGSDLLANECRLEPDGDGGYRLWGRKWLVGLGDRAEALVVCARTGRRGPGAFTLVLLEGPVVAACRTGTRPGTGMRGIGLAGFEFAGVPVPASARVGREGRGLDVAMRAMQYVRVMSTGANLAAADTGLRLALDFAAGHRVGDRPLDGLPTARRQIATALTALLAAEAGALGAARALHLAPEAQGLWSSVVKHVTVDAAGDVFARCGDLLGTHGLLREGPAAAFDTFRRDDAVVRHIDTGPVANLRLVTTWLTQAALTRPSRPADGAVTGLFDLATAPPAARLDALAVAGRADPVTEALPEAAAAVRAELAAVGGPIAELADQAVARLCAAVAAVPERVRALLADRRETAAPDLLEEAERFCFLHAAASCVHLWRAGRDQPLLTGREPSWPAATIGLLLARAEGGTWRLPALLDDPMAETALRLHREGRMFSVTALPLAEHDRAAGRTGETGRAGEETADRTADQAADRTVSRAADPTADGAGRETDAGEEETP